MGYDEGYVCANCNNARNEGETGGGDEFIPL